MSRNTSERRDDTYFQLMRMVQTDAQLTQREMADRVGLSLGGLNYCLKALVGKGWIKVQNFSHSRNKLGYVYLLTPAGIAAKASLTHQFLRRKMEEYESLRQEIAVLRSEAGDSPLEIRSTGARASREGRE